MNTEGFYYLGKILRAHGNKGEVLVLLDVDDPHAYRNTESVYLDLHGERIPFFIDRLEVTRDRKAVVRFQDFETREDAETLRGLEMYLTSDRLPRLKGRKFYFHEVTGFGVIDVKYGPIGTVTGVLELPRQALLQIRRGDKEILVPAVDPIIRKVDRKNRLLHIEAPEGLIELYS
ncbi:MAG TPA: ribosome maturation factor RimM [Bacteroidales bacterium]|nr:ribosome maturation factor RimM [Bacteroidales bacterium]